MTGPVPAGIVEAAAAAISAKVVPGRPWGDTADEDKPHYREEAVAALAATLPLLADDLDEGGFGYAALRVRSIAEGLGDE